MDMQKAPVHETASQGMAWLIQSSQQPADYAGAATSSSSMYAVHQSVAINSMRHVEPPITSDEWHGRP